MEIDKKSRRRLRLQGISFVILFLAAAGLAAWLSTRYHYQADWTAAGRNTLTQVSVDVLKRMEGPVTVTAFAREADTQISRRAIADFISRYQRHKADLALEFVNPDLDPQKVRENNIRVEGELVVSYQGRKENVQSPNEENFSNALQRLSRGGERHLIFLQGHGERRSDGDTDHDLGAWGKQLTEKGFVLGSINLAKDPQIPAHTAVLVVASPEANLLPGEVKAIRDYVNQGGDLLWLAEPGSLQGLKPLADDLGIRFLPGVIVDPSAPMLGINNPTFALVGDYPHDGATQGFDKVTVFPVASGLDSSASGAWQVTPLLRTEPRAWVETGRETRFEAGKDAPGPVVVGVALNRTVGGEEGAPADQQRIVVLGDGDFLSTGFLSTLGNLELGNRLVNWLSHDDDLITVSARAAPDVQLEMTRTLSIIIGFGFLLILPGALLGSGIYIWMKRRKR